MNRHLGAIFVLGAALTTTLAACGSTASSSPAAQPTGINVNNAVSGHFKKPIVIGAAVALTGQNAFSDTGPLTGARMAVADINKAGGIDGEHLKIVADDTTSTVAGSRTATLAAISQGAQVIFNGCNYDYNAPGGQAAQADGLVAWSQCAGSPNWGLQGIGTLAFTPGILTYAEGNVGAKFAVSKLGARGFALCDDWIDYTLQTCQGFKEGLPEYGGTLAGSAKMDTQTQTSFASQITEIKNTPNLKFIYLAAAVVGGPSVVRQIRAAGITLPIVSPTAMYGSLWTKAVPDLGSFYVDATADTFGHDPRSAVRAIITRYKAKYGSYPQDANVLQGYASVQMVAAAIKATGTTDGARLASYLETHTIKTILGMRYFSKTLHAQEDQQFVIEKFVNGKPSFDMTSTPGKVDLHLTVK